MVLLMSPLQSAVMMFLTMAMKMIMIRAIKPLLQMMVKMDKRGLWMFVSRLATDRKKGTIYVGQMRTVIVPRPLIMIA